MRFAAIFAGLALLGGGGLAAGQALAGGLPTPTVTVSTTLPITSTIAKVTSTVSKVTSTVSKVTSTVSKVTTTVPKITSTVSKVTSTVSKVTTTVPKITSTVSKVTTTTPRVTGPTPTVGSTPTAGTTTAKTSAPGNGPAAGTSSGGSAAAGPLPGVSSPLGASAGAAGASYAGSSFAAAAASSSAPVPENVTSSPQASAHASRTYLRAGRHSKGRALVLRFRLPRRARVIVSVFERYPQCRLVASFTVAGHRGVNRLKIRARVAGKLLQAGTYSITGRVAGGAPLFQLVLAVVKTRPTAKQLAVERNRNTCSSPALVLVSASDGAAGALAARLIAPKGGNELVRAQNSIPVVGPKTEAPPRASAFSPTRLSKQATNPFVIGALVAAMVLFGLAALPRTAIPDPRLNDAFVRHRTELAVSGAMLLAAAAFLLFLG